MSIYSIKTVFMNFYVDYPSVILIKPGVEISKYFQWPGGLEAQESY